MKTESIVKAVVLIGMLVGVGIVLAIGSILFIKNGRKTNGFNRWI